MRAVWCAGCHGFPFSSPCCHLLPFRAGFRREAAWVVFASAGPGSGILRSRLPRMGAWAPGVWRATRSAGRGARRRGCERRRFPFSMARLRACARCGGMARRSAGSPGDRALVCRAWCVAGCAPDGGGRPPGEMRGGGSGHQRLDHAPDGLVDGGPDLGAGGVLVAAAVETLRDLVHVDLALAGLRSE